MSGYRPGMPQLAHDNPCPIRERTRTAVYQLIRGTPGITRPDLIVKTGLSRTAVSHLVARLIAEGRVWEHPAEVKGLGSGSGRPAARLTVAPSSSVIGALDFGHNHVWAAVADGQGTVLADRLVLIDVDTDANEVLDRSTQALKDLCAQVTAGELAIVVAGIPGPVDFRTGLVQSPTILSGWVGLSPVVELEERLHVPVFIENDAVLGARGELHRGAGQRYDDFLYVKASHGVGAGIVIGGQPYRGATGIAGEIGHTQLANNTELCRCGNRGCLEAVVSVQAIRRQLAHTHPQLDADTIRLADLSDPISGRIFAEAGRTIGRVLADLCNLFNPAAVIIGGELGESGPSLIEGVHESILRFAQPATAAVIDVQAAALGARAELIGALETAAALLSHMSIQTCHAPDHRAAPRCSG